MAKSSPNKSYRVFVEMMAFMGHMLLRRRKGGSRWLVHYGGPFDWKNYDYRLMLEEEMA